MDSPRIGIGNLFLPAYQQRPKRNLTLKVGGTRFTQGSSRVFLFRAHLEIGALHKNKHKTSRFFFRIYDFPLYTFSIWLSFSFDFEALTIIDAIFSSFDGRSKRLVCYP